jgi:aromatic ring-cleaving dioxygenase
LKFKRWSFWLPTAYVSCILLMLLLAGLGSSSTAEGGAAIWILIFAAFPGLLVANAVGESPSFALILTALFAQALLLCLVGAIIDTVIRRNPKPILNRRALNPTDACHAHIYYDLDTHAISAAERLHRTFTELLARGGLPGLVLVGRMYGKSVGPHPKPQFEIQFLASASSRVAELIRPTGLTALLHPLTNDDLADHTTLAEWIGAPLPLDESKLDPSGHNQGIAQFGKTDF